MPAKGSRHAHNPTSIRLSPEARRTMDAICKELGLNRRAAFEVILRNLSRAHAQGKTYEELLLATHGVGV